MSEGDYLMDRDLAATLRNQLDYMDARARSGDLSGEELMVGVRTERYREICQLALEALRNRLNG